MSGSKKKKKVAASPAVRLENGILNNNSEQVLAALRSGVHINSLFESGKTPLSLALTRGALAIVRLLLEHGAECNMPDRDGHAPLHVAAEANSVACTAELLSFGADPSKIDASGKMADQVAPDGPCAHLIREARLGADLVNAARLGEVEAAVQLAEHGPHVTNFRDADKWSALHGACFSDSAQLVRILVQNGARLECKTVHGYTPLIEACATGKLSAGRALLECGANPDAVDVDGWTSLHYGAAESRQKVVQMLLDAGANVSLCTTDGKLASDVAVKSHIRDIIVARQREEAELRRRMRIEDRLRSAGLDNDEVKKLTGGVENSAPLDAVSTENDANKDNSDEAVDEDSNADETSDRRLRISKLASRVSLAEGLLSQSLRENEVLRDAVAHMAESGASEKLSAEKLAVNSNMAAAAQELRRLIAVSCAAMSCLEESGHHIRQVEDSSLDEAFIQFGSIEMTDKVLWSSSHSQVVEGRLQGRSVVVKRIKVDLEQARGMHRTIFDDVAVFPALRHPNLVTCLGVAFSPRPEIVFLRVEGPSIYQLLHGPRPAEGISTSSELSLRTKYRVIRGMCDALGFLHSQSCQHGRFSSRHVLLGPDMEPRICGFAMAKTMAAVRVGETSSAVGEWIRWASPERAASVMGEVMDCSRSDVYSFAMVCWELCSEIEPYGEIVSLEETAHKIRAGERPFSEVELHMGFVMEQDSSVPSVFAPMLIASLALEPSMRPSFSSCENFLKTVLPRLPDGNGRLDEHCRRTFLRELDLLRLALDRGEQMEPSSGLHAMEVQARWQWAVQQRAEHVVERALEFGVPMHVRLVGGLDYDKLARSGVSPSEMFELDDLVREPSFCPLDFVEGAMEIDWKDRILQEVSSDFGADVGDEIVRVYQQLYSRGAGVSRKVALVAIESEKTQRELSPGEILTHLSKLMRSSTSAQNSAEGMTTTITTTRDVSPRSLPIASVEVASSSLEERRKKSVTDSIRAAREELDELVEQLSSQAKKFMAADEPEKALGFLNKGLELDPDNMALRVRQSAALYACERFPESLAACDLALRSNCEMPSLRMRKANCLLTLGYLDEAEAEYREMLQLNGSKGGDLDFSAIEERLTSIQRVRTIIKLGSFLLNMKRFGELLKHVTEGRTHSSDNDALLLLQGFALIGVKEASLAIRTAEAVLLRNRKCAGAYLVVGFTAFECFSNLAFAVECFELADAASQAETNAEDLLYPVPSHDSSVKSKDELTLSASATALFGPAPAPTGNSLLDQACSIAWDIRRAHMFIREAMEALERPQDALPRIFAAQDLLSPDKNKNWGPIAASVSGLGVRAQLLLGQDQMNQ